MDLPNIDDANLSKDFEEWPTAERQADGEGEEDLGAKL